MGLCFSIASWSFHGLLESGKQDMFQYIADCKEMGCGLLDAWNGHLAPLVKEDEAIKASANPLQATFSPAGLEYVARVKAAADAAGMSFGCLAIDGAHMWEPTAEARAANRATAYRWLDVGKRLGVPQVRMDSGGTEAMPDDMFALIAEGFQDVIQRANKLGIEMTIENHWGSSRSPENVLRMLKAIDGLGLLFDSGNFAPERREDGWKVLVPYAKAVHIKSFQFDEQGNDPTIDIPRVVRMLVDAGYNGCWGVESVVHEAGGDEYAAARKTIALIRRTLEG